VRVVDDPTTGSHGRLDACLRLVLGQVQIDVDAVALWSGASICWNQIVGPSKCGSTKMSAICR
jgi:hypothetical protein